MAMGIWGGVIAVAAVIAAIFTGIYFVTSFVTTLSIAFVIICVLMMLIILAQKPKGGGLSGAFGGAGGGSTQTAFGAKTGDVMTWATIVLFVMFLGVAMGLTWATAPTVFDETAPLEITQPENATSESVPATSESKADTQGLPTETAETPVAPVAPVAPAVPAKPDVETTP